MTDRTGGNSIIVRTRVNGAPHELSIEPCELLIDVVREQLNLTGTKRSCDVQICGTCTIQIDGIAVSACTTLAAEMDGRDVVTVEGLASGEELSPLQEAFIREGAMQCGFCTPGFIMSATALLEEEPDADADAIADYLSGNVCRCGGYNSIRAAVLRARRSNEDIEGQGR